MVSWRSRSTILASLTLCALGGSILAASGDVPVGAGEELTIKPPLPVWPSDYETITKRQPTFRLNGRYGATRYRVELAQDATFTSRVILTKFHVEADRGITPVVLADYGGKPLENGQYYWRAFAGDDNGYWTPPANYRTFFIASEDAQPIASPAEPLHPRLMLSTSELDGLRRRIERSPRRKAAWQYIQNAAKGALDAVPPDEEYARSGAGQHGYYSFAASWYHRHLTNVAFVALVNADEEMAAKGVEMLMAACAYERWLGPLFDDPAHFDPPWNSALETAMMTTAVATGYDLLYPHLSDAQRATVREALVEKGIKPLVADWVDPVTASRLPRHQLPTGNWVMVCAGSAGVGALTLLGEHPDAAEWARLVRDRVRAWLHDRGGDWYVDNPWRSGRPTPIPVIGPSEPNFGIDGAYKESISYMNYAMTYVFCFADGLRRATGEDLFKEVPDNLLDHAAWNVLAWVEQGKVRQSLIPFGDSGAVPTFPVVYAGLTRNRQHPLAGWLGERIAPVPQDVRSLIWLDESVPGCEPDTAVPMRVFRDVGQVVMRRGWGPDTPAAAIKFHQNRGHLDIGTFYLFGGGRPAIIDSGTTPYGSQTYRDYSSRSVAHNLVLVDGKPQKRVDGELLAAVGTSRLTVASGQLAAAYPDDLRSWTRDMLMLPDGSVVLLDRLVAHEPRRFEYLLHPYPPFRIPYPTASPGEILIGDEANPIRMRVHSEQELRVSEPEGYYFSTPCKYVRLHSPEATAEQTFFTVCEWPSSDTVRSQPLDVRAMRPGRWQLRSVGEAWRLVVRTGADADADDSTDARMVAVWDQGERSRERHVLVLGGRRLGVDNRELMRATRPVSVAIEFAHPLRAEFWTPEPTRVALAADRGADHVFINGQPADAVRRGGSVQFDLPSGRSSVTITEIKRFIPRPRSLVWDDLLTAANPGDAPAFQPGVTARASSCFSEPPRAIDGNANMGWSSLPGAPMPQWMEVNLPKAVAISSVHLQTARPCEGYVELRERASGEYVRCGTFRTSVPTLNAAIDVPTMRTDRIRVTVEKIAPDAAAAAILALEWRD